MNEQPRVDLSERLPGLARLADLCVFLLAVAAAMVAQTDGFVARLGGVRLSVTSWWRLLLLAFVVLVLRHVWISRPSLWQRIRSYRFTDTEAGLPSTVPGAMGRSRLALHALVIAGFGALTCAAAFQQVAHLRSVADLGDPLFSMWRLDWVAYQLLSDPLRLFDANIFHPEPRTLAYSDAMLAPALVATPWLWLGADVVVVHNLLMLAATTFAGVTMFWLARSLTGSTGAAAVAGAVFALYPLRWAFYANLELEITLWMPLAALGLHRTLLSGRMRDGIATGLAVALQTLSSFYYGLFLLLNLVVIAAGLTLVGKTRLRAAIRPLGAGALLAAVIVAPVTVPYFQNRESLGERRLEDAARFSAEPRDYLAAHETSRLHRRTLPSHGGKLPLFPGFAPLALGCVGLFPPLSPSVLVYAAALGVSADASLGVNGSLYPLLYRFVLPFRGLRAPDRFAVLVGFALSVLAGFGAARILRRVRRPPLRILITAGLVAVVAIESAPILSLTPVWRDVPPIYDHLPAQNDVVLVDLPFPQRDGSTGGEYSFLYFATFHHKRLVNGGSGHYPPWYNPLADLMLTFPNDRAVAELKRHGAEYLVVHGYFFEPAAYGDLLTALDDRRDLALIARSSWNGAEDRLYRILSSDAAPSR